MEYYSLKLNQIKSDPEQLKAYLSEESTVVIAGPGSGKTTVLTLKIMRLLREKIKPPRGLACVTFSKEAAREFKDRLYKLGYIDRPNVFLGTVHSFCIAEVITPFANLYNFNIPLPIKIVSDKKKKALFNRIVDKLNYSDLKISIEEMNKERSLHIQGISNIKIPSYDVALRVANEYENELHKMGLVDYEDIVKYATLLIQEKQYVRDCLYAKFPWILIDEYQDLGRPLHEIILSLFTSTDINIFAVGDPDQSIYGFSGAIPDYLDELYRNPNLKGIELKSNYRSNQDIIDGSELVLNITKNYKAAVRKDEHADFVFITCEEGMNEQYECVVKKLIPYYLQHGIPLEEMAVLVGTNREVKELSYYFEREGLPFYISKHEFDRSDFVKWLENCASWTIDKTAQSFNELFSFWESLIIDYDKNYHLSKRIFLKRKLYETLSKNQQFKDNLSKWVVNVLKDLDVIKILSGSTMYPDETDNLEQLQKILNEDRYRSYDISKFSKLGKPENQVTLTTRHSSKGLEFEIVIMLGMEEERFPSYWCLKDKDPRKLQEEHRICFVCVSRAKKICVLVRSMFHIIKTSRGDWRKEFQPSRFWVMLETKFGKKTS